jgi:ATP-dependent 26S proteasome regulatory subunit
MSLVEALQNRTPLIWVDTVEPERLISQLPVLCSDRSIYIFDIFDGLLEWEHQSKTWKIVLIEVVDPDTGEMKEIAITHPAKAWGYVLKEQNAVFIVRNVHEIVKDYYDFFSIVYGKYRDAFWSDDMDKLPLQVVMLSTGVEPVPTEISAMTTAVNYGLPNAQELATIITHINSNYANSNILEGQNIEKIIAASAGMSELEAFETYYGLIRSKGIIDADTVMEIKFDKMKASSSLDISKPKLSLADVGGLENAKKMILQAKWIWENPDKAEEFHLTALRRILFLGLPGTGKSLICEAAANTLGLDLARTGVAKMMNKFIGESERRTEQMFMQINALAPICVWIDELGRDLSGGGSSDYVDGGTTSRVHGTFLTGLQELSDKVFLFAAANDIDSLPPEMLRADRFDKIMFVGFPSYEERKDIFRLNLIKPDEHDLAKLSEFTPCFTGAEIKSLCQRVRQEVSSTQHRHINDDDILSYIPLQKNRMWIRHRGLAMGMYERALDQYEWASPLQYQEAKFIVRGQEPVPMSAVKKSKEPSVLLK